MSNVVAIEYRFPMEEKHVYDSFVKLLGRYDYEISVYRVNGVIVLTIMDRTGSSVFIKHLYDAAKNLATPPQPKQVKVFLSAIKLVLAWFGLVGAIGLMGGLIYLIISVVIYPFSKIVEFLYG